MTPTFDPVQAIADVNKAYLNAASALSRTEPAMARVLLHLESDQVATLANLSPGKIGLVEAIPFALVRPLGRFRNVVEADSTALLLASFQSTLGLDGEADRDL